MTNSQSNIKVLLVEDNEADAVLVEKHLAQADKDILSKQTDLIHVSSIEDAFETLNNELVDVILLDLGLPGTSGIPTLKQMLNHTSEHPIIVLTGLDDGATAVEAIKKGAQDYLPKGDIDPDILVRAIRYSMERKENQLELKRQNERLDNFANVVSHDLRNPLEIAQGYTQAAIDAENTDHLDKTVNALKRMDNIIDDVLSLARQGDTVDDPETIELQAVVDDAWDTVDTKDCTLTINDPLPELDADRSRLRQQIENLFRNAVTHAGEDVTINIGVLPEDFGFYIADTGPGIPDEDKDKLFEQGFTTDSEGTGFGLNIVKQIANAHGWKIRVVNAESGGAQFEIYNISSLR